MVGSTNQTRTLRESHRKIIIIRDLLKPKRIKEQRKIKGSATDDLPISHMLFLGSGSHQASLITRPARSSLLYTDSESTASFRLSAEKKNPRHVRSQAQTLASLLFFYPLLCCISVYYISAYGVPVTVTTCGLRLLVPDPSPSLLIDALPCG